MTDNIKSSSNGIDKPRTPSGQMLEQSVSKLRTIFSPGNQNKNSCAASSPLCSQTIHELTCQISEKELPLTGQHALLNIEKNKHRLTTADQNKFKASNDSEIEVDNFFTPPATPLRPSVNCNKRSKKAMAHKSCKDQDYSSNENLYPISSELKKMIEAHDGDTKQTLDIGVVYAMFKKLETNFNDRMAQWEELHQQQVMDTDDGETDSITPENESQLQSLTKQVKDLKLSTKAIKAATHKIYESSLQSEERISKLEMNNNKKLAVLTGFYANGKKIDVIQSIERFILKKMEINIQIDDYFEIGHSQPKAKVLVLQNYKDKALLMRNKKLLKGVENRNGEPFYINDYLPTDQIEFCKKEAEIMKINQDKETDPKFVLEYIDGQLCADKTPIVSKVSVPNPQIILDLDTDKLQSILKLPVCKGVEVQEDGNVFIGFTLAAGDFNKINDAYLKMKLCYPKARHIVCAYYLDGEEYHYTRGSCDDGEHGAGIKLLRYMLENNLRNRVIFVVRYYSGKKIGLNRFVNIIEAANKCMQLYPRNAVLDVMQDVPERLNHSRLSYLLPSKTRGNNKYGQISAYNSSAPLSNKRRRESSSPEEKTQEENNDFVPVSYKKRGGGGGARSRGRGRRGGGYVKGYYT